MKNPELPKIIVDLDNIVFDANTLLAEIATEVTGRRLDRNTWPKYHLRDFASLKEEKRVIAEFYRQRSYSTLRVLPYAQESLKELCEHYRVCLVTSRPNETPHREDTFASLQTEGIPYHKIFFNPDKARVARKLKAEFCIEDSPEQALQLSAVCPCFLFDYPFNHEANNGRIIRVLGFEDKNWWLNLMEHLGLPLIAR